MIEVKFHPDARQDLQDALAWYDENNPAVGDRLAIAVERAIEELREHPRRWPLIDERHPIRPITGLPHAIFYRQAEGRIVIVAVSHSRRDPSYWQNRSDEEVY